MNNGIMICADVHMANFRRFSGRSEGGVNQRARDALDVLRAAAGEALAAGCSAFVVAGDLLDSTEPKPQVLAAVQRALDLSGDGLDTYVMVGNHDLVSLARGDHAIGPLDPVACVVEAPRSFCAAHKGTDLWVDLVPFRPGRAVEWLPEVLAGLEHPPLACSRALVLHLGLSVDQDPGYLRGADDVISVGLVLDLCREHHYDACFAGHWHQHRVLSADPLIMQVGALCPRGFNDSGVDGYGSVVFWRGGSEADVRYLPGPRFLAGATDAEIIVATRAGHKVYASRTARAEEVGPRGEALRELEDDGVLAGWEVLPDQAVSREAARKAATVASSADTLREALVAYVREMELSAGADRGEVLALAQKYLEV